MENPEPGSLSWRLSSHPLTLLTFLFFRLSSVIVYLIGLYFTDNYVLIFIITMLLLAGDFYNLKNIAGRRLVGLRWWNEINATDKRFFWLALYVHPILWVVLAILALVKLHFIWLTLNVIALILTITNTVAFSRCDKFSQASNMAAGLYGGGNIASRVAGSMFSRMFRG